MNITSPVPFIGGFLVVSLLVSILAARLTRLRDILWPVWILIVYNLGWDVILIVFGVKKVHQAELQLFGVLVGIVFGIVVLISVPKFFRLLESKQLIITRFDLLIFSLPVIISFLGLTIGVLYRNDISYLISDTYKLLILSGTYFVCIVSLRRSASARTVFGIIVALVLLQQVFDILIVAKPLLATGSYNRVADQFWPNRLLLFPFLGLAIARTTSMRHKIVYGLALTVTVIAALLSLYRTALILGASSFFLAVSPRTMPYFVRNLVTVLLIMAVAGGILIGVLQVGGQADLVTRSWSFVFESLAGRFNEMLEGGGGASIQVKFVEAQSVLNELLAKGSLLNWLAGFGSGAQYSATAKLELAGGLQQYQQVYGASELTHHIHSVFFAALLRYGLIGTGILLGLLMMIWGATKKLDLRLRNKLDSIQLHSIFVYFTLTLVVMNLNSTFWGDPNWGVLLAIASIHAKARIIERRNRLRLQYNTQSDVL